MITFGDIPLLVPTAEVQAAIDEMLPLAEVELYGSLPVNTASRSQSPRHAVGLPVYNWPTAPPPRLNCLYWPSGASRWARGWFLCDGKSKDDIVALCHPQGETVAQVLKFGQEAEPGSTAYYNAQSVDLFLLPPRPISGTLPPAGTQTDAEKKETLWLLPLVDRRYFFQFISSGLLEPTAAGTWADLFEDLETALGMGLTAETVNAAYLTPDKVEFTRRYSSCAVLLDAAAASVGQRIVKDPETNEYKSLDVAASETALTANYTLTASVGAGYSFDASLGDLPANVRVNFRRWSQYAVYCDGEVYTATFAATSMATPPTSTVAGDKIFHSTLYAEYPADTAPNSGSSPTNSAQIATLTAQIATDFYGWLGKRFDISYNGIVDWSPTGFDDAILWDCQTGRTRVWSLPAGVGVSTQLSQSSSYEVLETIELGKPDADIAAGASGTVSVWRRNSSGTLADSTLNVTATALAGDVVSAVYTTLFWNCGTWLVSCYES